MVPDLLRPRLVHWGARPEGALLDLRVVPRLSCLKRGPAFPDCVSLPVPTAQPGLYLLHSPSKRAASRFLVAVLMRREGQLAVLWSRASRVTP